MINIYKVVVGYMQRSHLFCNTPPPLWKAQDRVESTRVTIGYGIFINQFLPDTVKSIRQLKRTYTKYVDKTCLYCSMKYELIVVY